MKALIVLMLLSVSSSVWAHFDQQEFPPYTKTYICGKYTLNEIDAHKGFLTDNPIQQGVTVIRQTDEQFTIEPNVIFVDHQQLTNPAGGTKTGFAFNESYLFFKRRNVNNDVYFLVYEGKHKTETMPGTDDIDRLIAIADCAEE